MISYAFIAEQVGIETKLALGKITEAEAIEQMIALNARMKRTVAIMSALAAIVPIIVVVGLLLLAWRLGAFA